MGVFLSWKGKAGSWMSLPHVRGGVSTWKIERQTARESSPRAWGCFSQRTSGLGRAGVFPTCVGVFPCLCRLRLRMLSLPHVRGGVSLSAATSRLTSTSSPRAWGCFSEDDAFDFVYTVFPTCVGVFRLLKLQLSLYLCLPHVRGGVSVVTMADFVAEVSSPRA